MADILEFVPAIALQSSYPVPVMPRNPSAISLLSQSTGSPYGKDLVSVLCYEFSREETIKAANRLLLTERAVIPADRRSLFVRSECGDVGCGAITALVVKEGGSAGWKEFGYENNYEVRAT